MAVTFFNKRDNTLTQRIGCDLPMAISLHIKGNDGSPDLRAISRKNGDRLCCKGRLKASSHHRADVDVEHKIVSQAGAQPAGIFARG